MPNLKNVKRDLSLKEILLDKYVIAFLAIILVVAINQIVFSYLLQDRERAKAASNTFLEAGITNFGNQSVLAGTNDVVLAEFYVPDGLGNDSIACNYEFAGNPCVITVDTDGAVTPGVGTASDGINYLYDIEANGNFLNNLFSPSDGVCTDSLTAPTCVYVDTTDGTSCTDGVTSDVYMIGAGCAAVTDIQVGPPTGFNLGGGWFHYENPAGTTGAYDLGEDIWVFDAREDAELYQGSYWGHAYAGQWQGDAAGTWVGLGNPGGEGFIDLDPTNNPATGDGIFTGETTTRDEPVIIDKDGDSKYEDVPDYLIDADGGDNKTVGTNSQSIPDGASLSFLLPADNVCLNTLGLGPDGAGKIIVYVDGSVTPDCVPGNGGTDILIRDDVPADTGMADVVTNSVAGTFPYTFYPSSAGMFVLYYDNNPANGSWDPGSESLWLELPGSDFFNPNIVVAIEADGTSGCGGGACGAGTDDDVTTDGLVRGTSLNYLRTTDNVCLSVPTSGISLEDIYVDGDGDCIPGTGGVDTIVFDAAGDGLNATYPGGSTFDGTWRSATGTLAYWDHIGGANGSWDYGANAAATETLWVQLFGTNKYTSAADTNVYSTTGAIGGDHLLNLSTRVGPNGFHLIYSDTDGSGVLNSTDTILEDNGNVQTGPVSAPNGNGIIDREAEMLNRMNLQNAGTLTQLNNVRLNADIWWLGGDGHCDASDATAEVLTADPNYPRTFRTSALNVVLPIFFRSCIVADIPAPAPGGSTIQLKIPQLYDANSNGLFDDGDKGLFVGSSNDGPTGGDAVVPYTISVIGITGQGGQTIPESAYQQPTTPPAGQPTPAPVLNLPEGIAVGDVIKTADAKAVYLVTAEGKRRTFPNETVWNSYYTDFSKVKTISQDVMAQIPLGKNATLRAGTWLIKIPTDSKVYAVEPSGVARWIENASIAQDLYGQNWATRVIDLPDVFFSDYTVGDSLKTAIHPTGALIQYKGSTDIYYIENGQERLVSTTVFKANDFQDKFVIKDLDSSKFSYPQGDPLTEMADFFMAIAKNRIINNMILPDFKTLR